MMVKVRMSKGFAGVRDGEHQARAFNAGPCYELAADDDGKAVPGSLLSVVLAEKWGGIVEKGTPVEPELLAEASPQVQRAMADAALDDATLKAMEAAEEAAELQRKASEEEAVAKTKAAAPIEKNAEAAMAKRPAELKAAEEVKAKQVKDGV